MHQFNELVDRSTAFTLNALREVNERTVEALQHSGATSLVKTLQMIQIQKVAFAVGMFSIFEAALQDGLNCSDGFKEAMRILDDEGELVLKQLLNELCLAVNVLKHGRGRSYDALVAKASLLPFRVKLPGERFFCEGDVSEVSTLIEVDDSFVQSCADVIRKVSVEIKKARPDFN